MIKSNKHSKPLKPDKIQDSKNAGQEEHEEVTPDEIKIDDEQSGKENPLHGSGTGRQFHFQTGGCIGAILSLVVITILFTVFLPIGILALVVAAVYFSWQMRRFR